MSIKTERIASQLQIEIGDVIANELRSESLKFITVTHVKLAPDLSYAKVYFTTMWDKNKEQVIEELNKSEWFIKNELCKRKLKMRRIPELDFVYDDSVAEGYKIESIIKKLRK